MLFADVAYGWKEKQAGYVLALVGVLSVIVNVVLVGRVVKALGERRAMLFALACGIAGFIIYGFAPTGAMFLVGMPISALVGDRRPVDDGADHAPGAGGRAGPHPGFVEQPGVAGRHRRAWDLRGRVRLLHRPRTPLHLPGVAFLIAAALLACAWLVAWRFTDAEHMRGCAGAGSDGRSRSASAGAFLAAGLKRRPRRGRSHALERGFEILRADRCRRQRDTDRP